MIRLLVMTEMMSLMAELAMIRYTEAPAMTRLSAAREMTIWKAVMETIPTSGT